MGIAQVNPLEHHLWQMECLGRQAAVVNILGKYLKGYEYQCDIYIRRPSTLYGRPWPVSDVEKPSAQTWVPWKAVVASMNPECTASGWVGIGTICGSTNKDTSIRATVNQARTGARTAGGSGVKPLFVPETSDNVMP